MKFRMWIPLILPWISGFDICLWKIFKCIIFFTFLIISLHYFYIYFIWEKTINFYLWYFIFGLLQTFKMLKKLLNAIFESVLVHASSIEIASLFPKIFFFFFLEGIFSLRKSQYRWCTFWVISAQSKCKHLCYQQQIIHET